MELQEIPARETPDGHGAFPRLDEEQIAGLSEYGERRRTEAGDVLFREGDEAYDFFVVLDGLVAIVTGSGSSERLFAVHGPGRFLGELSLLTGQAAFFTAVVREPGEVLRVPVERVRELVASDPELGDLILRAFLVRRELLVDAGAGLRIIGSRFSPECRRLREFAARNRLPHRWIDLEEDRAAETLLREMGVSPEETPVVVWGADVLRNPSEAELAGVVGLSEVKPERAVCDLLVVGTGPSGLAASVYGASEGLDTVAFDAVATGGQAATSSRIENYLGFPSGLSGSELAERATLQARKFGARIVVPSEAASLELRDTDHVVTCTDGTEVAARTLVIATGARYRRPSLKRLEEFEGVSVHYAATQMEARLCRDDPVVVLGGANSAGQAALFLSRHAAQVRLVIRHADLERDMSRYLADRIRRSSIEVLASTKACELLGDERLEGVAAENTATGEQLEIPARAMFILIGVDPRTEWLGDQLALDENGFVKTGADASEDADCPRLVLETSRPGVFAAGDVRSGSVKRVASAVGEGSMAVRLVHEFLAQTDASST
jgi:thioredoxin reductase (NADPH)